VQGGSRLDRFLAGTGAAMWVHSHVVRCSVVGFDEACTCIGTWMATGWGPIAILDDRGGVCRLGGVAWRCGPSATQAKGLGLMWLCHGLVACRYSAGTYAVVPTSMPMVLLCRTRRFPVDGSPCGVLTNGSLLLLRCQYAEE